MYYLSRHVCLRYSEVFVSHSTTKTQFMVYYVLFKESLCMVSDFERMSNRILFSDLACLPNIRRIVVVPGATC